ncbi:hypothetical protein LCGC14_1300190 [marine sediment metagenome]|uniref:Uncharacterized protein n=1 Tax=marine sediment metagenome TaxID=412755 RepID=A0A0F9KRE3_9ZZZZ
MSFAAKALVTTLAKQHTARSWAYGSSFQVKYFSISAGGHDPTDPTTALAADASAVAIPGVVLFGPEAIDSITWESITCPTFVCTLDQGEYTGELSSVGLIAEFVYADASDPDPPLVGDQFLYAIYNRPRVSLTSTDGPTTFNLMPFL